MSGDSPKSNIKLCEAWDGESVCEKQAYGMGNHW